MPSHWKYTSHCLAWTTVSCLLWTASTVFADSASADCDQSALYGDGGCTLSFNKLSFSISAASGNIQGLLNVTSSGLSHRNDTMTSEIDGVAYRAELGDIDANGWPELYVYSSSTGSGSYGSLTAYGVNNGKSLTPIYLPPLEQSSTTTIGYMGHDEFFLTENRLIRRFPVYLQSDTNAEPTGGFRQLQYRLLAGEAGWLLQIDHRVDSAD